MMQSPQGIRLYEVGFLECCQELHKIVEFAPDKYCF